MGRELAQLEASQEALTAQPWRIAAEIHRGAPLVAPTGVDVWIDFSAPEATMGLIETAKRPIVIGTTGFSEAQRAEILHHSEDYPVLMSGNMSFGIEVLRRMVRELPHPKRAVADVSIVEEHHRRKRDAPSGTAKMIEVDLREHGFSSVAMHSLREGGIIGVHRVRWVTESEEIEITHRAFNRSVFAQGAVMAAEWLMTRQPGLYAISDIWEDE